MKSLREVVFLKNHPDKPLTDLQKAMYNEFLLQLADSDIFTQVTHVRDGQTMDIWNSGVEHSNNFDDRELANKILKIWIKVRSSMESQNS